MLIRTIPSFQRRRRTGLLPFLAMLVCGMVSAQSSPTNQLVQDIVSECVDDSGLVIKTLGSWITNRSYKDPLLIDPLTGRLGTSDHDMKLLVPPGTPDDEALALWKKTRRDLTTRVRQRFGDQADQVLKSINFYPPEQLHRQIPNPDAARGIFQSWGAVPNLGYREGVALTDEALEEATEGLFGEGSTAWIKGYESQGRIFYKDGSGKVRSGLADISEFDDAFEQFTPTGSVNTARQWADKTGHAIADGDIKSVKKYIRRLQTDTKKARGLLRVNASPDGVADDILAALEREPELLQQPQMQQQIRRYLNRSRMELNLLEEVSRNPDEFRHLATEVLQERGFLDSALELIRPQYLAYGAIAAFNALDIVEGYQGYREHGLAGLAMVIYKNSSLTACLTMEGLKLAKDAIVGRAAEVDCDDLLEGVITVRGYQSAEEGLDTTALARKLPERPSTAGSAEDLVLEIDSTYQAEIEPVVKDYIATIFTKGSQPTPLDRDLATAVTNHCAQHIRQVIFRKRSERIKTRKQALDSIRQAFEAIVCEVRLDPAAPQLQEEVTVSLSGGAAFDDWLVESEQRLKELEADNPSLFLGWDWTLTGPEPEDQQELPGDSAGTTFTVRDPGTYSVTVEVRGSAVGDVFTGWGTIQHQSGCSAEFEAEAATATPTLTPTATITPSPSPIVTTEATPTATGASSLSPTTASPTAAAASSTPTPPGPTTTAEVAPGTTTEPTPPPALTDQRAAEATELAELEDLIDDTYAEMETAEATARPIPEVTPSQPEEQILDEEDLEDLLAEIETGYEQLELEEDLQLFDSTDFGSDPDTGSRRMAMPTVRPTLAPALKGFVLEGSVEIIDVLQAIVNIFSDDPAVANAPDPMLPPNQSPLRIEVDLQTGQARGEWYMRYPAGLAGVDGMLGQMTDQGRRWDVLCKTTLKGTFTGTAAQGGTLSGDGYLHTSNGEDNGPVSWQASLSSAGYLSGRLVLNNRNLSSNPKVHRLPLRGRLVTKVTDRDDQVASRPTEQPSTGWGRGERNRFRAELKNGNLLVYGTFYHDELGRFSEPQQIRRIAGVKTYLLQTGPIENLSNAGYLLYEDQSGALRYLLLGLDRQSSYGPNKVYPRPTVLQAGVIQQHGYQPGSAQIEARARAAKVYWQTRSGQSCSALIHKYKPGVLQRECR